MKRKKGVILGGLAIGTGIGCVLSMVWSIIALPVSASLRISLGMIFSAKKGEEKDR